MDVKKVEELIEVLQHSRAEELCVRKGDTSVCIRKGHKAKTVKTGLKKSAQPVGAQSGASAKKEEPSKELYIMAPMVGIFHKAESVAKPGTVITVGEVVGTIESMKLLNDVVMDISGTVSEVMVEDGTPVEYGQPLLKIEPAA